LVASFAEEEYELVLKNSFDEWLHVTAKLTIQSALVSLRQCIGFSGK
jgi:hypothetical protein